MLGIRRYLGAAIDLFQGTPELFDSDALIDLREQSPTNFSPGLVTVLGAHDVRNLRHVAVLPPALPQDAMDAVRCFLDGKRVESGVRRISFLLPDKATYQAFRDALFASFPDTP